MRHSPREQIDRVSHFLLCMRATSSNAQFSLYSALKTKKGCTILSKTPKRSENKVQPNTRMSRVCNDSRVLKEWPTRAHKPKFVAIMPVHWLNLKEIERAPHLKLNANYFSQELPQ